jgi:hypothetical protein
LYSSQKQFLAVGKETTQGTPVTPTATVLVEKFEAEDKINWLDDTSLRGSMPKKYGQIAGTGQVEWSLSMPWYADTFGWFAKAILGDITTTGAAAPYVHAISTLNTGASQPSALTLVHYQGTPATYFARTYAGCCVSELSIKGNAESSLITMDVKGIGWPSAIAAAAPTSSPSTETPIAAWRYVLGIAGVASGGTQVKTTGEFEISINRTLEPIYTGQNASTPFYIHRGDVEASGKLKFTAAADETALTYMLNNTQPQIQLLMSNGVTPTSDAAYRALQIDVQKGAFKTSKLDMGAAAVAYDVEFDAIATTTNAGASGGYSPIKLTVSNAVVASTY